MEEITFQPVASAIGLPSNTVLPLPVELRLRIYSYLVPTATNSLEGLNIRLVSRATKEEFDHEVVKDIARYRQKFHHVYGDILEVVDTQLANFHDSQRLFVRLTNTFFQPETWFSGQRTVLDALHSRGLLPHIRNLEIDGHEQPPYAPSTRVLCILHLTKRADKGLDAIAPGGLLKILLHTPLDDYCPSRTFWAALRRCDSEKIGSDVLYHNWSRDIELCSSLGPDDAMLTMGKVLDLNAYLEMPRRM